MATHILRTPEKFVPVSFKCGQTVVGLVLFNRGDEGIYERGVGITQVKHTTLGGMLPGDMIQELRDRGFTAERSNGRFDREIADLRSLLDDGNPVPLFVNRGLGHWIAAWGYDDDHVYAYDTARRVKRDERGLTKYSNEELLEYWRSHWLWGKFCGEFYYVAIS